jgi:hypothetical protein
MEQQQQQSVPIGRSIDKLFIFTLTSGVILSVGLVTIVVVSVIPHFELIGWFAAGVVIICLCCIAVGVLAFTFSRIGLWKNQRGILRAGDVVVYIDKNGDVRHLSAIHERAKVPLMLPSSSPLEDEVEADTAPMLDEDIADLYKHGQSQESIAALIKTSRHQVRNALIRQGLLEESGKKKRG